jgi:ATP-dependent DNA ligase
LKLDGYRTIAFKTAARFTCGAGTTKSSRSAIRTSSMASKLPDETVIDGEVVAFDAEGNAVIQRTAELRVSAGAVVSFVFDLLMLAGTTSCPYRSGSDRRSSRRRCWRNSKSRVATQVRSVRICPT